MLKFCAAELEKIGIIDAGAVLDGTVIRMPKTYPAYFGSYDRFDEIREWIDRFDNLFLVGRNGMHKYNNQDHSMLTAMMAVDNIITGLKDKENIWVGEHRDGISREQVTPNTETLRHGERHACLVYCLGTPPPGMPFFIFRVLRTKWLQNIENNSITGKIFKTIGLCVLKAVRLRSDPGYR